MYAELHARSAFSFLDGASLPEEIASGAARLGIPAVALLDRDGLSGAPRFYLATKKLGLRAHIGAEITLNNGSRLSLIAATRTGYGNLCRIVTRMKMGAAKGKAAATEEDFAEHAGGLICLTGGEEGPLALALRQDSREALGVAQRLIEIFGRENVYAELQRHYNREEERRNQAVVEISCTLGIPLLATNGVCHAHPDQRRVLDVLTCIRNKVTIENAGRLLSRNAERHLKDEQAMRRLFAEIPEAVANTAELSSRLEFTLSDLGYEFPTYPVPPGETMTSFLRKRTEEGARNRYRPYHERARRQIERELALIEKLDLAGYFLIVWDIVRFCRSNDILVQGRGSAANSAVCYSLGITAVDPVGMDLLFERFLSEERGEWPDIDLDLPSGQKRERAIQYVYERYGRMGAAMTANVITYRGRSAAREVGKALGFDASALGRLSSLIRSWEWKDPKETTRRQFQDAGLNPEDRRITNFLQIYEAVQDLPRHLGQHSGGMVLCRGQLDSIVPLEPATMPGRVVVQWDKDDCAAMGILKVDLLGLGMMAVLEDTIALIRSAYGEKVDLAHLPMDDPAVYGALQNADTIGMFQVESRAQMSCLPRLRPQKFYDIVVQVALIRPGPIVGKMVHPYLRRRQGREAPDCLHPALEPVLRRTLGVPLFQEQLLRMAMICAGFSGGEAEELQRAFGFKRSEARMSDVEVKLRSGMNRSGITGQQQDAIVHAITSFALYGFPESHAASFALLAYASAWLKCRYLPAFTAAMLNNQPMGFYHPSTLIKDAQRHGLRFKPVDVAASGWDCSVEETAGRKCVRLGLRYVKGLRAEAGRAVVRERAKGEFRNIADLWSRVRELNKAELRMLASTGALNILMSGKTRRAHRRDALWEAERQFRLEEPLFEGARPHPQESPLCTMTEQERLRADYRGTGLTVGRHPMALVRAQLQDQDVLKSVHLKNAPDGSRARTAGMVIVRQRPGTAKGFVFLSLEDEYGIANVIVNPDLFDRCRMELINEPYLLVEGVVQNVDNVISIKAEKVEALRMLEPASSSHDFH